MSSLNLSFSKTLNPNPLPNLPPLKPPKLPPFRHPISSQFNPFPSKPPTSHRPNLRTAAGRSKTDSSPSPSSSPNNNRRDTKRRLKRKTKQFVDSFFYRLKNPHKIHADNFTQEELQQIGLGYDRFVKFMAPDDPNLKHPYDWYKYGQYGPYSWRGVVIGDPIRGRFSDERLTLMGDVRDQEEWEKIEMQEMGVEFGPRLQEMDESKGFRRLWVFVRHPKWRVNELPWQLWTLVCEVVVTSIWISGT